MTQGEDERLRTVLGSDMTQRARKLLGAILMIAVLIAYAIAATAIYVNFLMGMPWWVLILYFAAAGLLWFFPAALLIGWMSRPDR